MTNSEFRMGVTPSAQRLDAEAALLQAKTNYVQSLVDHRIAEAALEHATDQERRVLKIPLANRLYLVSDFLTGAVFGVGGGTRPLVLTG